MENPRPILWNFDGLYGWIDKTIVANEIQFVEDKIKVGLGISKIQRDYITLCFSWDQVIELPQGVGEALEKYNGNDKKTTGDRITET